MSDFDKEAERQKLREQFAEDESDREHTERMSELLLQGATMTNRHCDTCGDPIFRHEDQEFCPTCNTAEGQQAARQQAAQQQQDAQQQEATQQRPTGQQAARPDSQQSAERVEPTNAEESDGSGEPTAPATTPTARQPSPDGTAAPTDSETAADAARQASPDPTAVPRQQSSGPGDGLAEAHGALVRTVTRLARQAEASDDLGRTREYLAGAREAAEALSAVRQAER